MLPKYYSYSETNPLSQHMEILETPEGDKTYRFKKGPLHFKDGYYYIPFYTRYAINENGDILNVATGNTKMWSITKTDSLGNGYGYRYGRFINDAGKSVILFRNRALCLAFLRYGNNVAKLVTNHLDGVPGNDQLSNLEWATYSRNIKHAMETGLRSDNRPVLVWNLLTDEVTGYYSASECARALWNTRESKVLWRINNSAGKVFPDHLWLKFDDDSEWPEVPDLTALHRIGVAHEILAKNIFTGEISIMKGSVAAEKVTGVKSGTVLFKLQRKDMTPVHGFIFKYRADEAPWPEFSERCLRFFADNPLKPSRGIIAKSVDEELFFTSPEKAASHFQLSKKQIWQACRKDVPIHSGHLLSYYNPKVPTYRNVG